MESTDCQPINYYEIVDNVYTDNIYPDDDSTVDAIVNQIHDLKLVETSIASGQRPAEDTGYWSDYTDELLSDTHVEQDPGDTQATNVQLDRLEAHIQYMAGLLANTRSDIEEHILVDNRARSDHQALSKRLENIESAQMILVNEQRQMREQLKMLIGHMIKHTRDRPYDSE